MDAQPDCRALNPAYEEIGYVYARSARALVFAAPFVVVPVLARRAQDNPAFYRDVETKYIFGFTEGSGIGLEGEKEFSLETVARMGKRNGRYWASETKLEYEFTPNQYVQFELGPLLSTHVYQGVTDMDDRNQLAMSGFFGEVRYLLSGSRSVLAAGDHAFSGAGVAPY